MFKTIFWVLSVSLISLAQNHIEVIYPKDSQQIALVDSTFIFGNTDPKANLLINNEKIEIHKDGGFLAFLPVKRGLFRFDLTSDLNRDICSTSVDIIVGRLTERLATYFDHLSISPSGRTAILPGDRIEFSLTAKAEGIVHCYFDNSPWNLMHPDPGSSSFIRMFDINSFRYSVKNFHTFTCRLKVEDIIDSSRIYYFYEEDIFDSHGDYLCSEMELDSTDYYVVKESDFPPRVLNLTGRPRIIRTAPGKGYKLVNQPAGVRVLYTGETPDYYKIKLADDVTGFVRKTDARLEPPGLPVPQGEVSLVVVEDFPKLIQVSMEIGDKLPFEIHTDGSLMTVDLFGLVSDVDWIRFNQAQKYVESLWWTQPQNGVFRLNIKWYDKHFWGYTCLYEDDKFILKLKKRIGNNSLFHSPVKGLKIMLDPGHSHDFGAVGPTGLKEKDPNLWIAHELRKILMAKGAEVRMTRMGHEHLGVYDRVDMAVKWEADLLISIHNNALPDGVNPFVHNGSSVYYYFEQARPLAEAIHKHLLKKAKLPDHGLYYGNLALCRVTDCPSVLVECAFMMLPEQEALLKTDKFQRKCAKAIYKGICEYLGE